MVKDQTIRAATGVVDVQIPFGREHRTEELLYGLRQTFAIPNSGIPRRTVPITSIRVDTVFLEDEFHGKAGLANRFNR